MGQSRTQYTLRNISVGVVGRIVSLLLPFVIRTIILHRLGAEYAGLGSLFTSILQTLSVAELGFSSAIIFSLYKPVAEDNKPEICALLSLYKRIYQIVGMVILVAGLFVMPFLDFFIKGDYPADINLYLLYGIYLANTIISYFAFGYKNVILTVYQRQDILSAIDLVVNILRSAIQIGVLLICKNYYAYIIWLPIFTLATNIAVGRITKHRYPDLVCQGKIEKKRLSAISKQIKGVALGRFSLIARNTLDSIILSALCGLTAVAMYSNYYFVFSSVSAILIVLLQAMSASVGNSIVTETKEKNLADHHKFDFYFMWIVSWCCVCMVCLYQPFMKLWAGTELLLPYHTMILFCVYFYVNQLSQVRSIYSESAGLWWDFRYVTLAEMLANLTLNIGLGMWLGIDGIIIATIITAFLSSFVAITMITFKKFFCSSAKQYYLNSAVYTFATVLSCWLTSKACDLVKAEGFVELVLRLLVCVVIPNVFFLAIYSCFKKYRSYIAGVSRFLTRK